MVEQEGFQGLAEVLDEMKPVDDLHRLGRPPANAVGVEVAAITTDDGDRRMLGQPGGDTGGRAVRQEVHDAMRRQIDQDGAIPMAPPPGPLVDTDDLEGWRGRDRRPPDQAEQRGWTGGEPQAGREPGASIPAQRQTDRPEGCGQSMGVTAISRDEIRQALGEDPAPAGPIAAAEFPHGQLDPDGPRPPSQVRQVALVAAMHGRRGHGTAWAGGGWGCYYELEPHRLHPQWTHPGDGSHEWGEERIDQSLKFNGHNPL